MVAVVSGNGLGLFTSSRSILGGGGALGNPTSGRSGEQAYVNAATGNLVIQDRDEYLSGIGINAPLIRTYNSQGILNDDNGDNWRLGVHERLSSVNGTLNAAGSYIVKTFGDGAEVRYNYSTSLAKYVSTDGDGAHDTLSYNSSSSQWTWTDSSSRATQTYDSTGRLIASRDQDGNTRTYVYTGALLTSITDGSSPVQTTFFDYTGNNLTAIRVVSNGVTQTLTRYTYDSQNRLSQVRVDLSPGDNSITDGKVFLTTYTYDGTSTRVASISQGDGVNVGSTVSFTYQLLDGLYRVGTFTDAEGRVSTYTYTTPSGSSGSTVYLQTDITDNLGLVTSLVNDASGRLLGVLSPTTGGSRLETRYTYDVDGNVASITEDPSGLNRTTIFQYDSNGNLTLKRDSLGNTVTRTFSANNQLLTETRYTVPDPDGAGTGQPSGTLTTRYAYDSEDHLRFVVSADGRVAENRYTTAGLLATTLIYTDAKYDLSGVTTALTEAQLTTWAAARTLTKLQRVDYAYDFRGNLSTTTAFASTDSSGNGVAAGASITRYVYDQRGQLLSVIDPRGEATSDTTDFVTSFTYDGLGRQLTKVEWIAGGSTRSTITQFNDGLNTITLTLANGLVTTSTYNKNGELISIVNVGPGSTALGTTTYTYDGDGRLRFITDPTGVRQHLLYDEAGRKVATVDGDGTLTEFVYDRSSRVIKTFVRADRLTAATIATLIDSNSKPTNVTLATLRASLSSVPGRNPALDKITRAVYDNAGRQVYAIDEVGAVTQFVYDGNSRVTDEVHYATPFVIARATDQVLPAAVTVATSANDRRTRYFYDAGGNRVGVLDAAGYLTESIYDAGGRLVQQTAYADATPVGQRLTGTLAQLRPAVDNETTVDPERDINSYFFYDGMGRLVGTLDGEGYLTETVYDVAGNVSQSVRYDAPLTYSSTSTLASLKAAVPAAAVRRTTSFQYDGVGRLLQQTNFEGTTETYAYDAVNNQISMTRASGQSDARTTQTRYDVLGRVKEELTAEGSAQLAALSNPTQAQIDDVWSRYGVTYVYDLAGRRISATVRPNDSQTNTTLYFYDEDGRVRFEVNALGERKEYRYNALNQLTDEIAYVNRISTTGLAGGLLTAALITTLTASADGARDSRTSYQYTLTGQVSNERVVRTTNTAEDASTTYGYNAFGEQTSSIQQVDASRTLRKDYTYDLRGLLTQTVSDATAINAIEGRTYDAFGRLTRTTDARGKNWNTSYDRLGRVITSTDPASPARLTTYDAFDQVLTRTDELGNTTTYAYDVANRRVTITSPEGIVTSSVHNRHGETVTVTDGRGNVTTYGYDANGVLKTVVTPAGTTTHNYDRAGQEIETIDANGARTAYTYDAAGRVLTRTVDPTGLNLKTKTFFDGLGQAVWQQDANGIWTRTQFNRDGELVSLVIDPLNVPNTTSTQTAITLVANATGVNLRTDYAYNYVGKTVTVTEGAGSSLPRVTQYSYDVLGRRTQEAVDPSGLNLRMVYTYDLNGNVVAKTDAAGAVTRFVYNDENELIYTVDGAGAVTRTDYDAVGRVIQTTAYVNRISLTSPSALGLTISASDISARLTLNSAADQVIRTVYDRDGQVRYRIDATNAVTEMRYDAAGNVIQTTRYATPITVPGTVNVTTIGGAIATNAKDQTDRTVYDAANRAIFEINAEGYVTQFVYDGEDHVIKQIAYASALAGTFSTNVAPQIVSTAPSSGSYVIVNSTSDRVTRSLYDAAGRMRFAVDGEGYITELRYDAVGRQTRQIQYAAKYTVADAATVATVTAQVPATPGATEPVEQRIYDSAGRLVRLIDAENNITLHVYDAVGRETDTTVAYTTADASTTHRVFNAAGEVLEETQGYGRPEAATTRYVLDGLGRRTKIIDPRGIELAETDSAWAQAMRTSLGYSTAVASLSAAQKDALRAFYTTSQQFDANGRITLLTDPVSKTIATDYDAFGNAVKITDQRGHSGYFYFDRNNREVLHVDPEGYVTQTVYNAFGTADRVVHYANKVVGTVTGSSAPAIVTSVPNPVTGPYLLADSARDQATVLEHDRRDLQTRVTDAETNYETMGYDAFGNRTAYRNKLGTVYNYTFYRTGKVKTETVSPTVSVTVVDSAGVVSTTSQTLITEYTYDALGNVTTIVDAKGLAQQRTTTIFYDRLNRETRRDLPPITVFNGTSSSTQTPYTSTTYDRRGNVVETRDAAGNRTVNYYDALDRKVASVDPTGALSEYTYDDAGNLTFERTYSTRLSIASTVWTTRPPAVANDTWREMEYVYDANNRRIWTLTQSETYFEPRDLATVNGNTAVTGTGYRTGRIATRSEYDAAGNVVKMIDGRNYVNLFFYNKLGQQILAVDPLGYVTRFEYDGAGNVVRQWRYEQKLSNATIATLAPTSNPQTIYTEVAGIGQDRVTEYEYDRLGRKKVERLLSVRYSTVSDTGTLASTEAAIQSSYQYDAAGNLKQSILADGSQTDYEYDALGRLIRQTDPTSAIYNGMSGSTVLTTSLRGKTEWQYDALGNRTVQTRFGLATADNQVTRTRYDAEGHAIAEWDGMGARTDFDLDSGGRILRQSKTAIDVDGASHTYRTYFGYDELNRETSRRIATDEGAGNAIAGDTAWSSYNSFGDVSARGINSSTITQYRYDKLGNLFWTNADTGTPRVYVYDASGNAVIEVSQANGTSLAALTSPSAVQSIDPTLVQMKFSIYDARNQITDVFQAPMDFAGLTGALSASQTQELANSNTNSPGIVQPLPGNNPGLTSGGGLTRSVIGGWTATWTPPAPSSTTTVLNPSTVSQSEHGQSPISVGSSDVTYDDSPTVRRRVQRNAYYDSATGWLRETITTTITTVTTGSSTSTTTTQPDQYNYQTGTARTSYTTVTTDGTTTTTVNVTTVENAYRSEQTVSTTNQLLGGSITTGSQLNYMPPQTVTMGYQIFLSDPVLKSVQVPNISGYGTGPTRVLIEKLVNGSYQTVYDQQVFGPVNWGESSYDNYMPRARVWKGGVLLFDSATNGAWTWNNPVPGVNIGSFTGSTRAGVAVSGDTTGVASAAVWLGNGQSANLTAYDVPGGRQWIAMDIGAAGTSWQYNLYDSGGGLFGAVSGSSTSDPTSRSFYHYTRTDTNYYQYWTNDPNTTNSQQVNVTRSVQQSNYLRQLAYSLVSGTALSNQIHRSSSYNAFGEVLNETDGRQNVTQYQYNELGAVIRRTDPVVSYTGEDGVKVNSFTPITQYYVDQVGQTVATTDANNFTTKSAIRNGRLIARFNPDGHVERHYYDLFGNQAASTAPEINLTTRYQYDKNNRQTRTDFAGGNYDIYEYDALGNRIAHTNGIGNREKYNYDAEGRITRYRSAENRSTTYSYTFVTDIGTGGYRKVTTDAVLTTQTDDVDMFGKLRRHVDLNGRVYTYNYNGAGWLLSQTSVLGSTGLQNISYTYYANGYLKEIRDAGINSFAQFEYDKDGNRTMESYAAQTLTAGSSVYGASPYQVAKATYDALNRVVSVTEQGKYTIEYEYDKVGNRRRVKSTYYDLLTNDQLVQDFWYKYDSLNRFTTTMGQLAGTQIVRGSTGYDITYNGANQRKTQLTTDSAGLTIKETYAYDGNGFLTTVKINPNAGNVAGDGVVRAQRVNNVVGDRTDYYEFNAASTQTSSHTYTYDKDHVLKKDHDNFNNRGTNYVLLADGRVDKTESYNNADANAAVVRFQYAYEKWDSYKQDTITVTGIAAGVKGWRNGLSTFDYDVNGHLVRFYDHAEDRTIAYVNNQNGQTLKRTQWAGANTSLNPEAVRQIYYLYGKPIGDQAVDGSKTRSRVDYAQELRGTELEGNGNKTYIESKRLEAMPLIWQQWGNAPNPVYGGNGKALQFQHKDIGERVIVVSSADFDQNFQPINEGFPPATAGIYIVRTGDTLHSIAASMWGDGSLWYLIAEANGLTGQETLVADMRLVLPNVVSNIHNNANTFRPVDPDIALGDTSPTLPDPPPPPRGGKGCGMLGTVLIIIVAIVVTVYTAGLGTAGVGVGSGFGATMSAGAATLGAGFSTTALVAGAVGAVASQGVAMALGMQKGFDWAGVAIGALGAAVGAGIGKAASNFSSLSWLNNTSGWSGFSAQAVRGAIGNAVTQGVSMAAGLQKQFSWSQVAASAAGAAVGNSVGNWLEATIPSSAGQFAKSLATGFGSSAASAGVYQAITGQRANYGLIAAQSFGTALGNSLVTEVVRRDALVSRGQAEMKRASQRLFSAASAQAEGGGGAPVDPWDLLRKSPAFQSALDKLGGDVSVLYDTSLWSVLDKADSKQGLNFRFDNDSGRVSLLPDEVSALASGLRLAAPDLTAASGGDPIAIAIRSGASVDEVEAKVTQHLGRFVSRDDLAGLTSQLNVAGGQVLDSQFLDLRPVQSQVMWKGLNYIYSNPEYMQRLTSLQEAESQFASFAGNSRTQDLLYAEVRMRQASVDRKLEQLTTELKDGGFVPARVLKSQELGRYMDWVGTAMTMAIPVGPAVRGAMQIAARVKLAETLISLGQRGFLVTAERGARASARELLGLARTQIVLKKELQKSAELGVDAVVPNGPKLQLKGPFIKEDLSGLLSPQQQRAGIDRSIKRATENTAYDKLVVDTLGLSAENYAYLLEQLAKVPKPVQLIR